MGQAKLRGDFEQRRRKALEDIGDEWGFTSKRTLPNREKAIAALRAALAEQVDWSRSDTKASIVNIWQAINHQIMPVKLTQKMIAAALPQLMREDDEDKHRALGQLICVWDALVEAVKEEGK